jgi:hypothetical protein
VDGGFRPTYSSDEEEDEIENAEIEGEGKQEELDDFDIETALRCRRMMTHPDSSYSDYGDSDEDDDEEVAQSQSLF